jgi:hypothetical protein
MLKAVLDLHFPGRPYLSLRGFFWNVKVLSLRGWLLCAMHNCRRRLSGLVAVLRNDAVFPDRVPAPTIDHPAAGQDRQV